MKTMTTSVRRVGEPRGHGGTGRRLLARGIGGRGMAVAALGAVVAAALGAGGTAHAASFGVRVLDETGRPVVGASVCIGLEGNYRQFGTAFTDIDGWTDPVEVPNVPLVVTVSKTRFAGLRHGEPARGYNVVRELTLVQGLPGPRCRADSSMVANPPVIDVRDVEVVERDGATTLRPSVTGEPSEYRLARDEGFADEEEGWRRFDTTIELPPAFDDAGSVALQLRRFEGSSRGWVEARSGVVTIDLRRDGGRLGEASGG